MSEIERRHSKGVVKRADGSRTVEGYALLFDVVSDGLPWEERIAKGALDGVLEKSDVLALLNHDSSRGILARWKGKPITLNLSIDERGLKYQFEAPKTALGDELLEYLNRGEIEESSFAFEVESNEWNFADEDNPRRTITKIKQLYDVSPVFSAAYSATSVSARAKEELEEGLKELEVAKEEQRKADEAKAIEIKEKEERELEEYIDKLKKRF